MEITYNGVTKEFEKFTPMQKHCIKINIKHRFGGDVEGIWACLDPKDREDYDNSVIDKETFRVVNLRNMSIGEIPFGALVPVQFLGESRPMCDASMWEGDIIINDEDTV